MFFKHSTVISLLIVCAVAALAGCKRQDQVSMKEADARNPQVEKAVRGVLDDQVLAWNRGDIEAFMNGYAKSDDTMFVSGDNVTRGWKTVLDRYKKNYETREKMGTLAFSELDIKALGDDAAVVVGKWQLTRANDTPHGRFTLVFRRTPDGWRIINDHTSTAE